jgi:hypothetical protein
MSVFLPAFKLALKPELSEMLCWLNHGLLIEPVVDFLGCPSINPNDFATVSEMTFGVS